MKRSTQIGLAAAGVVLVATVWSMSGDDTPNEDLVYNSLAECREANQLSAQACETAFADASAKRLAESPKFQRQTECEAQYGAGSCSSAMINGAQYFLPALAGFMLARNLSGGGLAPAAPLLPPTQAASPPGSRVPGSGRPECEPPRSSASSSSSSSSSSSYGGSRRYSTTSGGSVSATNSVASRAAQSASSRGGFGSTSRSFSSSSAS